MNKLNKLHPVQELMRLAMPELWKMYNPRAGCSGPRSP